MMTMAITMNQPSLNPLLAVVIPLARPSAPAARALRAAAAPVELAGTPSEEQCVLGVECALPEGFTPY